MSLQEGSVYRAPDGRLFKAEKEVRRYGNQVGAWTLVPLDIDKADGHSWRDTLSTLLFMADDRIVFYDFMGLNVKVRDTGWRARDLDLTTLPATAEQ